jgi:SNF2 family DNA or RNA helicase
MGLGKTLQAISVAYYFKSEWPLLIVVPSSMKYIWVEEIEKWFPEIMPHEINLLLSTSDVR